MTAICEAVDELTAEGPGDVLVFLSGEREIRDAAEALRGHLGTRATDPRHPRAVELLPLYSRLSAAEQHRVFQPHGTRRVVLATNVAETSLTVPGVRYVVDPGTARISRFSKSTKVQRLPIEPISQASANQRSGRCGRVADGIAIRLYSEADFASRPEFTEPEILRTSLASVILQMIAVGVVSTPDDVARFPFVEPPDVRAVRDGVQLLTELGALTPRSPSPSATSEELGPIAQSSSDVTREPEKGTRLTEIGRGLALLPMDPRLGRMIIEGGRRDVAREVMVIAAALSIQDPRERPAEQREQADQQHARFADPTSDFLTYLNLWTYVREQQRELSGSAFRRLCRAEHLNYLRLREWQDVVAQLSQMAKSLGITVRPPGRRVDGGEEESLRLAWDGERIHRSILSGLLSHVGMQEVTETRAGPGRGRKPTTSGRRQARNEYQGARGARFAIFPGSRLSRKPPAWIMAAELVETSRLWARDVARIEPEWAEELAEHLVKRVYSEPAWSTKRAAAIAQEKVLLYGLPIVAQRRVLYAKVDPEHARELFIRHALVQGEWTTHHEFFDRNRALLADAEELEHRARRRGLVVDDDALFDFYDERVPDEVVSARHFDTWWKTARRREPDLLTFSPEMLLADEVPELDESRFPSRWPQGDLELPVTYQFDPGSAADGVTVHIPLPVLGRVRPEGFDWLVPGMLTELATATIRALPKPIRVQLVPAPDVARDVVDRLRTEHPAWEDVVRAADMAPSFHEAFAGAVRDLRGVQIPDDAWDDQRLPSHLRVTFRVHEERAGSSTLVDEGPNLVALQRRLAGRTQQAVRTAVRDAVQAAVRDSAAPRPTGVERSVAGVGQPAAGVERSAADVERSADEWSERARHAGVSQPERSTPEGGSELSAGSDADGTRSTESGVPLEQVGLSGWPAGLPDGRIPEVVRTDVGGMTVLAYPALVVEPTTGGSPGQGTTPKGGSDGRGQSTRVSLRVLAHEVERDLRHDAGVRELLLTELALPTGRVISRWSATQSLTLAASPYPTTSALVTDLQRAAVDAIVAERTQAGRSGTDPAGAAAVRDEEQYATLRTAVRDALEDRTFRVAGDAAEVLTQARALEGALQEASSPALLSTVVDLRSQLDGLVGEGFVSRAGAARLPHLVRYLRAGRHRLDKAIESPQRDESIAWQVRELTEEYDAAVAAARTASPDPERDARHDEVRWMLEELRVSLFAQQLGTAHPVSAKRVRAALAR